MIVLIHMIVLFAMLMLGYVVGYRIGEWSANVRIAKQLREINERHQ